MKRFRVVNGIPIEKGDDHRRATGETAERDAVAIFHRLRTIQPSSRQMFHEIEKERQIGFAHALFVKGENETSRARMEVEIRVFDAFRNSLAGEQGSNVIGRDEVDEFGVVDFGVDSHRLEASPRSGDGAQLFR